MGVGSFLYAVGGLKKSIKIYTKNIFYCANLIYFKFRFKAGPIGLTASNFDILYGMVFSIFFTN